MLIAVAIDAEGGTVVAKWETVSGRFGGYLILYVAGS
jgi:hypothetical protein